MKNPAPVEYPVHELIRERWSPRAFSRNEISSEDLRSLFEAARWAPSSSNEQPWAFIVATRNDNENFTKALQPLVEFNANWAKNAYVLGFAVAELAFAKNNTSSRGIFVHQMAGFDPDTAREVFEIPSGWDAIAAFAMGYPGDPASLPQPYRDRETAPRVRKPIGEFVMNGKWGHTADFILK